MLPIDMLQSFMIRKYKKLLGEKIITQSPHNRVELFVISGISPSGTIQLFIKIRNRSTFLPKDSSNPHIRSITVYFKNVTPFLD